MLRCASIQFATWACPCVCCRKVPLQDQPLKKGFKMLIIFCEGMNFAQAFAATLKQRHFLACHVGCKPFLDACSFLDMFVVRSLFRVRTFVHSFVRMFWDQPSALMNELCTKSVRSLLNVQWKAFCFCPAVVICRSNPVTARISLIRESLLGCYHLDFSFVDAACQIFAEMGSDALLAAV